MDKTYSAMLVEARTTIGIAIKALLIEAKNRGITDKELDERAEKIADAIAETVPDEGPPAKAALTPAKAALTVYILSAAHSILDKLLAAGSQAKEVEH